MQCVCNSLLVLEVHDGLHGHLVDGLGQVQHLQPLLVELLQEWGLLNSLNQDQEKGITTSQHHNIIYMQPRRGRDVTAYSGHPLTRNVKYGPRFNS